MEIGIIGLGTMGQGIAQVFAMSGYQVMLYDSFPQALDNAKLSMRKYVDNMINKSKLMYYNFYKDSTILILDMLFA